MQTEPYVSMSGQMTLERRFKTLAINIANMNTIGYRASGVTFHTFVDQSGNQSVSYATPGEDYISQEHGPLIRTGNPLDVAVQGDGWFAIQTPAGTAYTRDGRMQMQPNGALQTLDGYPILDAGGAGIQLDPNGGQVVIAKDGMINQNGRQIGAIGLFTIPKGARFTRYANSSVLPDQPAVPVLDFDTNGVIEGHLEGSNVNPVLELAKLMTISRSIESISGAAQNTNNTFNQAIKTLGDVTS